MAASAEQTQAIQLDLHLALRRLFAEADRVRSLQEQLIRSAQAKIAEQARKGCEHGRG